MQCGGSGREREESRCEMELEGLDWIVCETSVRKWRLLASEQVATFLSTYKQEDYKKVLVAINRKGDVVT